MTNKEKQKIKKLIKKLYPEYAFGIFNTPNIVGDRTKEVYSSLDCDVLVCEEYGYIEIFCNKEDFKEFKQYYKSLKILEK